MPIATLFDLVRAVGPTERRQLVVHADGDAAYMGRDWVRACVSFHVVRSMSRKRSLGWKTIRQHRVELGYAA